MEEAHSSPIIGRRPPVPMAMKQETENPQEVARQIAQQLGEQKHFACKLINDIVNYYGVEFAQDLLKETLQIEENGGMMTLKGDRRRTPGGVFIYLARERMSPEEREIVFNTHRRFERRIWKRIAKKRKRKKAAAASKSKAAPQEQPRAKASRTKTEKQGRRKKAGTFAARADVPTDVAARLEHLHNTAAALRKRMEQLEAQGQYTGLGITRKLLENTEREIAALQGTRSQ